jgi:hypothetical protein
MRLLRADAIRSHVGRTCILNEPRQPTLLVSGNSRTSFRHVAFSTCEPLTLLAESMKENTRFLLACHEMRNVCSWHVFPFGIYLLWGYAVAQLVEALRYKPEGCGFDSWWSHWKFSVPYSFRSHCGSGVDSASNINEYQKSFLGIKTAGA